MPHANISHPTRGTLEWRRGQTDEDTREAVADITAEIGVDRPPLVHIRTRERGRSIRGRVAAPGREAADGTTSDWRQALANYVDLLESHCDEFQGDGYTFTDDIRSTSFRVIYHNIEWSLAAGNPYEIQFQAEVEVGRGTFDTQAISQRNPTVDTSMNVAAKVDGNDLPGLREMSVRRGFDIQTKATYDEDNAENNDIVAEAGVTHEIIFRGTHTGTNSQRASADATLDALQGTANPITFETRFPGYHLDGFVTGYNSNLEARFGDGSHHYVLTFIEGQRA